MRDAHTPTLLPLLRLQGVCAATGPPLRLFWPMRGLPQLPLLPELLAVHVVRSSVCRGDERRGLHRHIEGGRDLAQRAAAADSLDHARLRLDPLSPIFIILYVAVMGLTKTFSLFFMYTCSAGLEKNLVIRKSNGSGHTDGSHWVFHHV